MSCIRRISKKNCCIRNRNISRYQTNNLLKSQFLFLDSTKQCVLLTISVSLQFRACYITSHWGDITIKNSTLILIYIYFFDINFCCFSSKSLCFYHSYFFFDEISNFRNRILTNQKLEQVIRNCQRNCMKRTKQK